MTTRPTTDARYLHYLIQVAENHERSRALIGAPTDFMSLERFVLRHGRLYETRFSKADVQRFEQRPRACFANSLLLATRCKDLTYVEGFAVGGLLVHHAWCVDYGGNVIDPTWQHQEQETGTWYFGVPFNRTYADGRLTAMVRRTEMVGSLIVECTDDDYGLLAGTAMGWQA